jgi:hypothetical protein
MAPRGRSSSRAMPPWAQRIAGIGPLQHRADESPRGRSAGTSFIECTAMSARSSSIATSSSLMNRALAADGGQAAILNAIALRQQRHQLDFEARMGARSSAATCSACQSASCSCAWQCAAGLRAHMDSGNSGRAWFSIVDAEMSSSPKPCAINFSYCSRVDSTTGSAHRALPPCRGRCADPCRASARETRRENYCWP